MRQFGPKLGEPVSPTPPELLHPLLRLVPLRRGRFEDVESRAPGGGRDIFCKGQGAGTTLAEAFDHADVSLIDLLDFDGDAAPIGAGVEEIERF